LGESFRLHDARYYDGRSAHSLGKIGYTHVHTLEKRKRRRSGHSLAKQERERKNCSIVGCHCRIRNYSAVGVLCDDVKTGRAQMMG
jgi:hypothetical protein